MITQADAAKILEAVIAEGQKLAVAGHADLPSVKGLMEQCLEHDIPAVLGPCSQGG